MHQQKPTHMHYSCAGNKQRAHLDSALASPFHATSPSSAAAEIDLAESTGHQQVNDDTTNVQFPSRQTPPTALWNVKKAPTRLRNKSRNSEDANFKGALGPGLAAGDAAAAAPWEGGGGDKRWSLSFCAKICEALLQDL